MRIASRLLGIVLALAGLAFLVVAFFAVAGNFDRKSVLSESGPDTTVWIAAVFSAALGIGCILAGRYFLKLDINALDDRDKSASRFAPYLVAHRRTLNILAAVGLASSLIRLGSACFGVGWPGPWAAWPSVLVFIALAVIQGRIAQDRTGDQLDWQRVPEWVRPMLRPMLKAGGVAFLILVFLWTWSQWSHEESASRISQAGLMALLFAWEALFFQYGALRAVETPGNVLKS